MNQHKIQAKSHRKFVMMSQIFCFVLFYAVFLSFHSAGMLFLTEHTWNDNDEKLSSQGGKNEEKLIKFQMVGSS